MTVVHKATVMRLADGLFLQVAKDMSKLYPDITMDAIILDKACLQVDYLIVTFKIGVIDGARSDPILGYSHGYA